jgi:hypothetical protein
MSQEAQVHIFCADADAPRPHVCVIFQGAVWRCLPNPHWTPGVLPVSHLARAQAQTIDVHAFLEQVSAASIPPCVTAESDGATRGYHLPAQLILKVDRHVSTPAPPAVPWWVTTPLALLGAAVLLLAACAPFRK